jgi:DNA-directed RNA polymerase subunit RPC12/RpoP
MYCAKCGAQLPDDAAYCFKCGTRISTQSVSSEGSKPEHVIAPSNATSLKCPSCGAPITPKFGEMVITCEYCGSSVALGALGWSDIQKQTMLPLKIVTTDEITACIKSMMDKGLLHRHLQENSTLEEMSLSYVPYWVVGVSARTSIVASDIVGDSAKVATTAALFGVLAGGMGGGYRRGGFGFGGPLMEGALLGTMMGGGMGGGGSKKAIEMDENYNFPIIALKALTVYQPHDYQFALDERTLFDISKIPKGIKILNGDISEDAAKYQAKTLVDELQSQKAHSQYHMIQQINTQEDIGDVELLHAPIWFARYDHKGNKIVLVVDANSGMVINSIGLKQ